MSTNKNLENQSKTSEEYEPGNLLKDCLWISREGFRNSWPEHKFLVVIMILAIVGVLAVELIYIESLLDALSLNALTLLAGVPITSIFLMAITHFLDNIFFKNG